MALPMKPKKKLEVDDLDELATMRLGQKATAAAAARPAPAATESKPKVPPGLVMNGKGGTGGTGYKDGAAPPATTRSMEEAKAAARAAAAAKGPLNPGDDLDDVVDARMAAEQEIDAQNAQATLQQRARSGLMGGGLSGASSAAEGNLARQQARSKTLALQDFDRQAENDDFTDIQRRAAIMDLEDAYDTDIDGDGTINGRKIDVEAGIGDGDIENDPTEAPRGTDAERQALEEWTSILDVNDYNQSPFGDADTQPGSFEEPFSYTGTKTGLEAAIREAAPGALPLKKLQGKDGLGGNVTIYVDKYGNHYTIAEDTNAPSRREQGVR